MDNPQAPPPTPLLPTLLVIAGSDPTGGAGIQADLKTISAIGGVYGAAAITCLTVQNARGVSEILPLAPDFVARQIQAVLAEHRVTHIKIGMVGTLEIAQALGEILADFAGQVIYDPVLVASSGHSLMSGSSLDGLRETLIRRVTILTPNQGELERITGHAVHTHESALAATHQLLDEMPQLQALVIKGGHLESDSPDLHDLLVEQDRTVTSSQRQRIDNPNLHGTGCTFASALSTFHCRTGSLREAFLQAGGYMDALIKKGMGKRVVRSRQNGPLLHTV